MIPEFPQFKNLELSDKEEVEKFTSKFPPYSDFNFVSMWSWDIKGEMRISQLNGNLVVKFADYLTEKPFLSFIGKNKVPETSLKLISFSKENYHVNFLKLIPEEEINMIDESRFVISPDRDSQDYIYSVNHLGDMHNWLGHRSSKSIEKFLKLHPDYLVKISSIKEIEKKEYIEIFGKWATTKKIENHFESNEYKAFKRFLEIKNENIEIVSLHKNNQLLGFTAYEITSDHFAIAHFSKADTKHHSAIYDILNWEEGKSLKAKGVKYYNWEQDLGIPGLRKSKEKYKPSHFLKKFIVQEIIALH